MGAEMDWDNEQSWEIRSLRSPTVIVTAPNWLAALGLALAELGMDRGMDRLACERLPNGQILVNDLTRRERYTLRAIACARISPETVTEVGPDGHILDWMLRTGAQEPGLELEAHISIH